MCKLYIQLSQVSVCVVGAFFALSRVRLSSLRLSAPTVPDHGIHHPRISRTCPEGEMNT